MDEHPIALDVKNLSKRYGSSTESPDSLKDISFEIPLGKICCLLGPNGSGKTTLLKIMAGLLEPTTGTILIHGLDPQKRPLETRASMGWMPAEERSGLYGRLTGRENLKFFGSLYGVTSSEMDRVIGNLGLQIGIQEELDKPVLKISSGAKQKIGLARALLHNPPILLLDEPLRNLDPHTVVRFRRLLKDHLTRGQKKTVLLSTHQLEEAKRIADLVIFLQNGRMIKTITSKEWDKELKGQSMEEFYLKTVVSETEE